MAAPRAFDPDPKIRWLFCLTHPDDELSVAVWIRRCVQNGCEVWLSWTHATFIRQAEARAVARLLGVPPDRIVFHGATDGAVCDEMGALLPSFRAMMARVRPDRVVCGAFEQGHLDHDATHWLVTHTFRPTKPERAFKRLLARQYPSQNIWSVLLWYELVHQGVRLRPFRLAFSERLRPWGGGDYRRPAHAARLARRVRRSARWRRWLRAVRRAERALQKR
jgi:LmbE family N-acetylglucosaminyl deacetylase